jgi:tRNA threonylcarbamoyl adenosine modification protein YeaZ
VSLLAISTSSPALSIALVTPDAVLAHDHRLIGRGHAEALVPAVQALLAGRRPDAILVDVGPGSYTGIRIGIAAARALGLAWGVPVTGCTALALVAQAAFAADAGLDEVLAVIDAGRGQALASRVSRLGAMGAAEPISTAPTGITLAGAGVALLAGSPGPLAHGNHPDAAFAAQLPAAQAQLPPQALYAGG